MIAKRIFGQQCTDKMAKMHVIKKLFLCGKIELSEESVNDIEGHPVM